jgi:hypothetical protein
MASHRATAGYVGRHRAAVELHPVAPNWAALRPHRPRLRNPLAVLHVFYGWNLIDSIRLT